MIPHCSQYFEELDTAIRLEKVLILLAKKHNGHTRARVVTKDFDLIHVLEKHMKNAHHIIP